MRLLNLLIIFIFSTMLLTSTSMANCSLKKSMDCHDCHESHVEGEEETHEDEAPKKKCSDEFCCLSMTFEEPFHDHIKLNVAFTSNSFQYIKQKSRDIIYLPFMPPIFS